MTQRRLFQFNKAIFEMETVYKRVVSGSQISLREALTASRSIVKVHVNSVEFYVPIIGMLLLAHSSGSVLSFGGVSGEMRAFYAITTGVASILIPILLSLLLLPLHILFNVRYTTIALATAVLSAYALCLVYTLHLNPEVTKEFDLLIFPLLIVYGVTSLIVTMRLADTVCFITYKNEQSKGGIHSLVPLQKRGELVSMMAQDHYVEVTTSAGSHLNRMTMKDAVNAVPQSVGMQIHRSHWVAFSAMQSIKKSEGRTYLAIRNGTQIPLSKSKVMQVQRHLESR